MSDANDSQQVKLKKNGDLTIMDDGAAVAIARYDEKTGRLEFTSKANSVKYYQQATARIGSTANGTEPSGKVIRSIGYAGDGYDPAAKRPARPKFGPEGDSAEDVVQYYLDHNLPEAIARYGIYTDANGKPVRKHVRRVVKNIVDQRNQDDDDIEWVKTGPKTNSKTPVSVYGEIIEERQGVIARRATRLTFTPSEVVGGWQPDDDFEDATAAVEGGDE